MHIGDRYMLLHQLAGDTLIHIRISHVTDMSA